MPDEPDMSDDFDAKCGMNFVSAPNQRVTMAAEAIAALQSSTTEAERRAALLQAMPYNTEAHPDVQQAFQAVRQRQYRMGLLVANFTAVPVSPTRQSSHRERLGFLMEAQTRRSLGLDDSILKRAMKDTCKSFRCPDCDAEDASYMPIKVRKVKSSDEWF